MICHVITRKGMAAPQPGISMEGKKGGFLFLGAIYGHDERSREAAGCSRLKKEVVPIISDLARTDTFSDHQHWTGLELEGTGCRWCRVGRPSVYLTISPIQQITYNLVSRERD